MNIQCLHYTTTFFFFLIISSLVALLFHLIFSGNGCKKKANLLPPSPIALPLLGHLHLLGPLLHQSLHALAHHYGPIIHLRLGSLGNTVVVSSPTLAKEFLKTHNLAFSSRLRLVGQEEYLGGEDAVTFGFLPFCPRWKFFKKVLMTQLLSAKKLDKTAEIWEWEIKLFLESLLEKSRGGESADLEDMLAALTHSIICRTKMGMRSTLEGKQKEVEELKKLVQKHIELAGKLNMVHLLMGNVGKLDLFGYGKRLKKANKRYVELVEKIIEEREREKQLKLQVHGLHGGADEEDEYLLDFLLKVSEDEESKSELTRHSIKTFLLDISGGGTETVAIAMHWALAELLRHPITIRKAREEID